ncbi:MAG: GntR family transcriptional regulator [Desulfobacula sp.]|nr:GntR family transcriptional regulator [Desulfobacula sp.]
MIDFMLDPKSGIPFYRQIIDQIRFGVATGTLKIGEQLPTVRALAVLLKVNLNTVSKAYRELEIQNLLETQQGTGTFIGNLEIQIPEEEREKKLTSICTEFFNIASSYGFSTEEIIQELKTKKEVINEN